MSTYFITTFFTNCPLTKRLPALIRIYTEINKGKTHGLTQKKRSHVLPYDIGTLIYILHEYLLISSPIQLYDHRCTIFYRASR